MTSVGMSSFSQPGIFRFIRKRDHALMHRIHHWQAPDWVRLLMVVASHGGDGWIWYGLGFLILLFGDHYRFVAVFAGSASTAVGLGIYSVVKKATRRLRPCLVEPHDWARILPPDQYSFPSGHTIAAFSIATGVGLFYPMLMLPLLGVAFVVAISRILLGMHFLSDVVVGVLLGTSLGYAAFMIFR